MANGQVVLMVFNQLTISLFLYAGGCKTVHPIFGHALVRHLHQRQTRKRFESCVFACQSIVNCLSINYDSFSWQCDLNNATAKQFPNDFVSMEHHIYGEDVLKEAPYCRKLRCENGGTCIAHPTPPREICICKSGFRGSSCEGKDTCFIFTHITLYWWLTKFPIYWFRIVVTGISNFLDCSPNFNDLIHWFILTWLRITSTRFQIAMTRLKILVTGFRSPWRVPNSGA